MSVRTSTQARTIIVGAMMLIAAPLAMLWAPAGRAAALATSLEWAESSLNSDSFKGAFARCDPGQRVVGGGAAIVGGGGRVGLAQMKSLAGWPTGPDFYYAWGQEKTTWPDYTANWKIVADAICVDSMPGLTYVTASGSSSVDAVCSTGKVVVGTGGSVNYLDGHSLQWIRPMGVNGSAATSVRVVGQPDYADSYRNAPTTVSATAACAYPPPGYVFLAQGLQATKANSQTVTACCPTRARWW